MIDPHLEDDSPAIGADDRTVRQFAALSGVLLELVAVRLFMRGFPARAAWLTAAALAIVAIGVARPRFVRPVFMAAMAVTIPIRFVVSTIILAIMYYGIFTPLAVVFRLAGRDALSRQRRDGTHWVDKEIPTDVESYFRQS